MEFGTVAVQGCVGAILAHTVRYNGRVIKKGKVLDAKDLADLEAAGIGMITIARLAPGDLDENVAADRISSALVAGIEGIRCTGAFTGRVNIYSEMTGLLIVDTPRVKQLNLVGSGITLATLPDKSWVEPGKMLATLKIVTYGVPENVVTEAARIGRDAFSLKGLVIDSAGLVITVNPDDKPSVVRKGRDVMSERLAGLGIKTSEVRHVEHRVDDIARALPGISGEMIMILTTSATSDVRDVGPHGLIRAGGVVENFGIPVDPGNLLFHGWLEDRPVLGLPGCARSPALNGTDWFLERIACGIEISREDIAAMGVGGLLKEIPSRPHPRERAPA